MPTYEYACSSCAHEWEAEQSIKADALTECPRCHAATARRQISRGAGFILKGGGWASDNYGTSSNKADKADKGGGGSGSSSSTDGAAPAASSTPSAGTPAVPATPAAPAAPAKSGGAT